MSEWRRVRLRRVCDINPPTPEFAALPADRDITFLPLEAIWPDGLDTARVRPKRELESGYTRFHEGDVLVPKITPTFEASRAVIARGLLDDVGCGTTELHVLRPRTELDTWFLFYVTHSRRFLQEGAGAMQGVAGQKRVPESVVADYLIDLPPLAQQRRIADFLDRETARIDELLQRRSVLQGLIDERTRSWAAGVVCGGLRPTATKDSGIQGLGSCPAHWQVTILRHLPCDVQTGPFGSQLHADDYVIGGVPVVNPANLIDGFIVPDKSVTVTESDASRLDRYLLRRGDVVFGRRGELGRAALVSEDEDGWLCGTGCLRVRFRTHAFEPSYLREFLRLPVIRQYFESVAIGSTMGNLNSEVLLAMPLLVPPLEEQAQIAAAVGAHQGRTSALLARLSRQRDLFIEHRQALITAAVTGQIEVSDKAA